MHQRLPLHPSVLRIACPRARLAIKLPLLGLPSQPHVLLPRLLGLLLGRLHRALLGQPRLPQLPLCKLLRALPRLGILCQHPAQECQHPTEVICCTVLMRQKYLCSLTAVPLDDRNFRMTVYHPSAWTHCNVLCNARYMLLMRHRNETAMVTTSEQSWCYVSSFAKRREQPASTLCAPRCSQRTAPESWAW